MEQGFPVVTFIVFNRFLLINRSGNRAQGSQEIQ